MPPKRLWTMLVDVHAMTKLISLFKERLSNPPPEATKILNALKKLPKGWYIMFTEGNLLEWGITLNQAEYITGLFLNPSSKNTFKRRCEKGLFLLRKQDHEVMFSVYNIFRAFLLNKCKELGYSQSRIKEVAKFDDFIAELLIEKAQPNLNGSPLEFLTKYVKWYDDQYEKLVKEKGVKTEQLEKWKAEQKKVPKGKINLPDYVDNLNTHGMSQEDEELVNKIAVFLRVRHELWKLSLVQFFHHMIKRGYSPQVWFLEPTFDNLKKFITGFINEPIKIDWEAALTNIERFPFLSFFRTPEFEVYIEDGKVHIVILQPEKVTTMEWDNVRAVYARFRRRLKAKRKAWGEVSGKKEFYAKMRTWIKDEFWKIRSESPEKGVYGAMDLLIEEVRNLFGKEYSVDTLRRLVYPKGSVENICKSLMNSDNK